MATREAQRAHGLVKSAIERGVLIRSKECELCGSKPYINESGFEANQLMVAHHYKGYERENALKIWWLCRSCNRKLHGYHNGCLSKEQARELVLTPDSPPLAPTQLRRCAYDLAPGIRCKMAVKITSNGYCYHHRNSQP